MFYPVYFFVGGIVPLGVLLYFILAADVGPMAKGITSLIFFGTYVVQALAANVSLLGATTVYAPMLWVVVRICIAVFLLVWLKADEVGLEF